MESAECGSVSSSPMEATHISRTARRAVTSKAYTFDGVNSKPGIRIAGRSVLIRDRIFYRSAAAALVCNREWLAHRVGLLKVRFA